MHVKVAFHTASFFTTCLCVWKAVDKPGVTSLEHMSDMTSIFQLTSMESRKGQGFETSKAAVHSACSGAGTRKIPDAWSVA